MELEKLIQEQQKSEHVVNNYKNHLIVSERLYEAIKKRIETGYIKTKTVVLGFIPIVSKNILDTLDIQRLELELVEIENTIYNNKKMFEMWLGIKQDNERALDEETRKQNYTEEKSSTMQKV